MAAETAQALEIDYTIYVATSRERLWEGLTTAALTRRYWAEEIRSDWTVGAAVESFALDGTLNWHGTVLEHEPPHLLSYTFGVPGAYPPASRVRFELTEVDADQVSAPPVVRLRLTHDCFDSDEALFKGCSRAWPELMSSLKSLLENDRSLGFVYRH
jgi:uncharacterized protein YndB with AHSA1/START domain